MADQVDYAALAKQAGAVSSQPAGGAVDYAALAKQAGAISSSTAAQPKGWLDQLADVPKGIWDSFTQGGQALVNTVAHPLETLKGIGTSQDAVRLKAEDSFKKGNYAEGVRHVLNYLVPLVGPGLDASGDLAQQGQVGRAVGQTIGTAAQLAGPKLLEGVNVPIAPGIVNANPTEAAALSYLEEQGVPVSAGAKTGNAFVKNIQKAADSTPVGAVVAQTAQRETTAALRRTATKLVSDATPEIPAEDHYTNFRIAEGDPGNTRKVPSGDIDERGMPKYQSMPLPIHVGMLKDSLVPVYEEMQWMPAADRNASAGYQAVKKIVEGPDYIPASQAEIGLSGLKSMAREGAGRAAGIAKMIVPNLQELIDTTVGKIAGGDAVDALQQGRKSAAAEIGRDWLTNAFKKAEAEGGFNREQGVWADWLRLNDEAKRTMFTPAQVGNLNNFFLGVKKLAENPNPSGTAILGISATTGGLLLKDPATGIPVALGAGAVSKMLHSPAGVRALTNGLKVPLKHPAAAAAAGQILKMAGNEPADQQQ